MSGETSGATARFASGEMSETRPNASAEIGSEASVATKVAAIRQTSSGRAKSSRPMVAETLRSKPTSQIAAGATKRRATTAAPSAD